MARVNKRRSSPSSPDYHAPVPSNVTERNVQASDSGIERGSQSIRCKSCSRYYCSTEQPKAPDQFVIPRLLRIWSESRRKSEREQRMLEASRPLRENKDLKTNLFVILAFLMLLGCPSKPIPPNPPKPTSAPTAAKTSCLGIDDPGIRSCETREPRRSCC